jgi:hypothetical protein
LAGDDYAIADMDVDTALFEIKGHEHPAPIDAHDPERPSVSLGPVTSLRLRQPSHAVVVPLLFLARAVGQRPVF